MQAPLRMERIIPHIVALGVGRLLITSAKKVGREGGTNGERERMKERGMYAQLLTSPPYLLPSLERIGGEELLGLAPPAGAGTFL